MIPLDAANVFGAAGLAGYRIALDRVAGGVSAPTAARPDAGSVGVDAPDWTGALAEVIRSA